MQVREGEKDDLKACIESAAVLESRLTAVEWSQIALVALQGTQVPSPLLRETYVAFAQRKFEPLYLERQLFFQVAPNIS